MLALLIEITSLTPANKGLKKPIEIPRPGAKKKAGLRHPDDQTGETQQQPIREPLRRAEKVEGEAPTEVVAKPVDPARSAAFSKGIGALQASGKPRGRGGA